MNRKRFFQIFKNLPPDEKPMVICLIDDRPYSWNVVKIELQSKTALGRRMLQQIGRVII